MKEKLSKHVQVSCLVLVIMLISILHSNTSFAKVGIVLNYVDYGKGNEIVIFDTLNASPAEGLLYPGDRVVSVDGNTFKEVIQLTQYIENKDEGDQIRFEVLRNGENKIIDLENKKTLEPVCQSGGSLSPDDIIKLKKEGISDSVIKSMIEASGNNKTLEEEFKEKLKTASDWKAIYQLFRHYKNNCGSSFSTILQNMLNDDQYDSDIRAITIARLNKAGYAIAPDCSHAYGVWFQQPSADNFYNSAVSVENQIFRKGKGFRRMAFDPLSNGNYIEDCRPASNEKEASGGKLYDSSKFSLKYKRHIENGYWAVGDIQLYYDNNFVRNISKEEEFVYKDMKIRVGKWGGTYKGDWTWIMIFWVEYDPLYPLTMSIAF